MQSVGRWPVSGFARRLLASLSRPQASRIRPMPPHPRSRVEWVARWEMQCASLAVAVTLLRIEANSYARHARRRARPARVDSVPSARACHEGDGDKPWCRRRYDTTHGRASASRGVHKQRWQLQPADSTALSPASPRRYMHSPLLRSLLFVLVCVVCRCRRWRWRRSRGRSEVAQAAVC